MQRDAPSSADGVHRRQRDRKHPDLASRQQDAQMTEEEIAAEILHAARNAR